jgi:S-DNA-T family DNA segregation ATPase FtsK/SpoIIIE
MDNAAATESLSKLFAQLKIKTEIRSCRQESSFLVFDLVLRPGGTFRKIERYSTEIALGLKALSEPLIYPITKEGIVRMEVMVSEQGVVHFSSLAASDAFLHSRAKLPLVLGACRLGLPVIADLTEMPHLLIGGTTGSGKSVMLHSIINGLLMKGDSVNLALIDPKRVEFSCYDEMLRLYSPIARNVQDSLELLQSLIAEMERRFVRLEKDGCRDIRNYGKRMPFIVIVIDELADLMMVSKKVVQDLICRLAQKSRACGMHLIVATQRPSVDVVTGLIKANFPARISCQVSSIADSRTILDRAGAEKLVGKGDAIIDCQEYRFKRFKGSFIEESDIVANVDRRKTWWCRIWNS